MAGMGDPPSPEEAILVAPYDDSYAAQVGFGIAISGGVDNPLFTSGEAAVVISDVVPNGPAWGLLQVNDRILSANGISFDNIEYGRAVDVIKHSEHINMIVKRRVAMPVMEYEQRTLKFTLTKSRKKDDFGIVLGCKFYIKEIRNPKLAEKDPGLREGDSVLRINGQSLDGISLDEASKWLERSREKLCLVIQRDVRRGSSRWPSTQTVYERLGSVVATPRHSPSPLMHHPLSERSSHEYINSPSWRDSNKGVDCSPLDPSRLPSSSPLVPASPHSLSHHDYQYYSAQSSRPEDQGVRTVCFHKVGGSVGIRVVGGNEVGIFVSAVAVESPAALHGVCTGDRILEVNGRGMRGMTREAAVQLLLSLEERVVLKLEHAKGQFEHIRQSQVGDNFFIRAHFTKEKKGSTLELVINEGDIFHVTDTLFGGTVGLWQAARVYSATGKGDGGKGVIPNLSTAENFAREARRIAEQRGGKGTLLRRKLESRRTKSLPKNMVGEELGGAMILPAYERVSLNTPTFHRPLVLYGPLADLARRLLLSQFALRFAEPEGEGVIRLSAVDAVINAGKHCILDITIDSVERLQLAQYAPIVILIDVDGRSRIREMRKRLEAPRLSSRRLAEQSAQIKKHHAHLLSATVDATQEDGWFDALRDLITHLQQRRLWMPEMPSPLPLEDLLLFSLKCDKDSDSEREKERNLHTDYVDYTQRSTSDLTRSIYDWDSSSDKASAARWSTIPRNVVGGRSAVGGNEHRQAMLPAAPLDAYQRRPNSNPSEERGEMEGKGRGQPPPSPRGYFHVQQLLNDREETKLVNELASSRLDDRERGHIQSQDEQRWRAENEGKANESTKKYDTPAVHMRSTDNNGHMSTVSGNGEGSSPTGVEPSSSGVSSVDPSVGQSPGEKPVIPPKPSLYGDSNIRNKWTEPSTITTVTKNEQTGKNAEEGTTKTSPCCSGEEEEGAVVIEQATAWLGPEGGLLSCPVSNVQLIVPPGAIPQGQRHEVYIKVCEEGGGDSPADEDRGEQLLSPLVMCGPHGLHFLLPVELRLPHSVKERAGDDWKFSLKTGDGEEWKHVDVTPDSRQPFISLPISKF